MNFLSMCSGIEAASVAWGPLGWKAYAFSEIEPYPCDLLKHHYPSTPNWGDMTKYKDWPDADVDLLCGGTPCQSFSVAGLREGLADPRGDLMLTFVAIAAKYRPRWVVWENVPGVLSSNGGRDFASFLGLLTGQRIEPPRDAKGEPCGWDVAGVVAGIPDAYGVAWRVLDAQYFGLAQRRKRVFVVGYLGDWHRAAAVLLEPEGLRGDPAPRREAGQAVAACVTSGPSNGGAAHGSRSGSAKEGLIVATLEAFGGNNTSGPIDISSALSAHGGSGRMDFESETFIAHALRGEGFDASEDGTGRGTPLVPVLAFDTTQVTSAANRSNPKPGDPCHPLAAHAHAPAIAFDARQHGVIQYGEKTGPLDTNGYTIGVNARVRRPTPMECERLQGFPDGYTAIPRGKGIAKDGPRYKGLGNSWAVPVVRWIGERIAFVDKL